MRPLQYEGLDLKRVKPAFAEARSAIEAGDFKSPDVKKLHVGGYCRAERDHSNRLLLQFARRGGETVCLALEVIANRACDTSPASCARPRAGCCTSPHREELFVDFGRHGVEDSALFEQRPRRDGRRPCGQAASWVLSFIRHGQAFASWRFW